MASILALPGMGDFELPKEMLAALPSDPYEQLDVARKITSLAVGARVSELEAEARTLQQELDEKDITIHSLEDHVASLEQSLQDTSTRLSHALEVQVQCFYAQKMFMKGLECNICIHAYLVYFIAV